MSVCDEIKAARRRLHLESLPTQRGVRRILPRFVPRVCGGHRKRRHGMKKPPEEESSRSKPRAHGAALGSAPTKLKRTPVRPKHAVSLLTEAKRLTTAHEILVEHMGDGIGLEDRHPAYAELFEESIRVPLRFVECAFFPRSGLAEKQYAAITELRRKFTRLRLDFVRTVPTS